MPDLNWTLEIIKALPSLLAAIIGGGLALFGGYLVDKRKARAEDDIRERRQRALLTGMFAVRNHVTGALNVWQDTGLTSELDDLKTSQAYVHRLIDKVPIDSESLMIAIVEVGLHLDTLLQTVETSRQAPTVPGNTAFAHRVTRQVDALIASLEHYDILAASMLFTVTAEDLERWGYLGSDSLHPIDQDSGLSKPRTKHT